MIQHGLNLRSSPAPRNHAEQSPVVHPTCENQNQPALTVSVKQGHCRPLQAGDAQTLTRAFLHKAGKKIPGIDPRFPQLSAEQTETNWETSWLRPRQKLLRPRSGSYTKELLQLLAIWGKMVDHQPCNKCCSMHCHPVWNQTSEKHHLMLK